MATGSMAERGSEGPLRVLHAIDSLRTGGAQVLLAGLLDGDSASAGRSNPE